jgi:two-component system, cell cycle sensor histidine kinase PleC
MDTMNAQVQQAESARIFARPEDGVNLAVAANMSPRDAVEEPWQNELLENFIRGQLNLAAIMPLLSVAIGLTAWLWSDTATVIAWFIGAFGSNAIQLMLCKLYMRSDRNAEDRNSWIGKISASEFLQAVCWISTLYVFWPVNDATNSSFLIATIMLVTAVRFMVVNNFMPVLIAGTGVTTLGLATRCVIEGSTVHYSLAILVLALEVFFLFIARQLQETSRDLLVYRAQKDRLIEELKLERDKAETERKKAQDANLAKSSFLANMSHELRTPLNAILGFSEILVREMFGPLTNESYKHYAGDIHHSGRHLLDLINDILDLSRIEAGRSEMQEEPVYLLDAANEAVSLVSMRARAKNITISVSNDIKVPKVMADRRSVNQIAINLLTNAIKFSPAGGHVEISAKVNATNGVDFIFKDDGPGIPAEEIEYAMGAFSRGSFATKKAIDGAGLGLPIVKGLMQIHGGFLAISNLEPSGALVTCTFPPGRVLSGPRAEIFTTEDIKSDSQRKLIKLTG